MTPLAQATAADPLTESAVRVHMSAPQPRPGVFKLVPWPLIINLIVALLPGLISVIESLLGIKAKQLGLPGPEPEKLDDSVRAALAVQNRADEEVNQD